MNKYLEKIALASLEEHQQRVQDKMQTGNHLIVAHSMGSGKTLTALKTIETAHRDHPTQHATIIVPASLVSNIHNEIKKHGLKIDLKRLHVRTYDGAVRDADMLTKERQSVVALDEAHKIRNEDTARSKKVSQILQSGDKTMLMTGTPSYNKPHEIAVLANKAVGHNILPSSEQEFSDRYIHRESIKPGFLAKHLFGVKPGEILHLKNKEDLRARLKGIVDIHDARAAGSQDFPSETHHTVNVQMDQEQEDVYKFLEGKMSGPLKWKIRFNLPLNKQESANLNAFSSGVRQASNHIGGFSPNKEHASPKVKAMTESIVKRNKEDKNFRGVVYSNYLESGLTPYSKQLKEKGISHHIYHGGLNQKQKDAMVKDYNEGKVKVLMVSSSGSEGLDLKGTKLVQIMEPHFNKSKIDQVTARAIRYKSHEHLPANERHVDVEHYQSSMRPGFLDKLLGTKTSGIDQYLTNMSEDKESLKREMKQLLTERPEDKKELKKGAQ